MHLNLWIYDEKKLALNITFHLKKDLDALFLFLCAVCGIEKYVAIVSSFSSLHLCCPVVCLVLFFLPRINLLNLNCQVINPFSTYVVYLPVHLHEIRKVCDLLKCIISQMWLSGLWLHQCLSCGPPASQEPD